MADTTKHLRAFGLYALIAVVWVDHFMPLQNRILGAGGDPYLFIWCLRWFPWAVAHHQNLLTSPLVWQPLGVNLLWITSMPLLCAAMVPVTILAGPVVAFNMLVLAAPVLAAWCAYRLAFHVTRDGAAALIGGFLFGFGPAEMAADYATPNLSMSFLLPCLVWLAVWRLQGRVGRLPAVMLAVAMFLAVFFISTEMFAMAALFGGLAWGVAFAVCLAQRRGLRILLADALLAGAITAVLLSPLLIKMLEDASYLSLPALWPYFFVADPANWLIPTRLTWLGGLWAVPVAKKFPGLLQEQGAYLGVPLIMILVHAIRARQIPFLLTWLLAGGLLLSLGPALWIGGHYTGFPLPWSVFLHLPLISAALPARFSIFVALVVAVLVPLWVTAAPAHRKCRLGLAACACLAVLPAPHVSMPVPGAKFFQPGRVAQVLGPDPVLLVLPFGGSGASTYWQQEAEFSYRQTGGYLGFPPRAMQHFAAVGQLFGGFQGPHFVSDLVTFLQATQTGFVVAGPGTPAALRGVLDGLGWQRRAVDDVVIYTVPHA
jgi:hypothetical protein